MKKLLITDFGTIEFNDGTVMDLIDFLENMNQQIDDDLVSSVTFNQKDNTFYVLYDGEEYQLMFPKEKVDIVSKLNHLIQKQEAIKDGKKGKIKNQTARDFYMEYLEKKSKFSFKNYLKHLKEDIEECREKVDFNFGLYVLFIISDVFWVIFKLLIRDFTLKNLLYFYTIPFIDIGKVYFLIYFCIRTKVRIKNSIIRSQKKKEMEMQLQKLKTMHFPEEELIDSKESVKFSYEKLASGVSYQENILNRIDVLIEKISSLPLEKQKQLASMLQQTLQEYSTRQQEIETIKQAREEKSCELTLDNPVRLEWDMKDQLAIIEDLIQSDAVHSDELRRIEEIREKLNVMIKPKTKIKSKAKP